MRKRNVGNGIAGMEFGSLEYNFHMMNDSQASLIEAKRVTRQRWRKRNKRVDRRNDGFEYRRHNGKVQQLDTFSDCWYTVDEWPTWIVAK